MTLLFSKMLNEMQDKKSETLIIDVRDNGGGWSAMGELIYYILFGDKYLSWNSPVSYSTLLSQKHLEMQNLTIEEYNAKSNTSYKLGDYSFSNISDNLSVDEYGKDEYSFKSIITNREGY